MKDLFRVAEYVYKIWEKIPKTEIKNQETTINIPESTVDYTLMVSIPRNLRSIRKRIEVSAPSIIRVSASSLHPFPRTVREAIREVVYDDGQVVYVLYPELLPSDVDLISMTVSYSLDDISLIDDLVDRQKAHEPSGSERNEYWISAQLRHPKNLIEKFGRFDLKDVDVTVNVGIHNELKNTIPQPFIRRLREFFDIMAQTDPRQQWKAIPRLRTLAKGKTAGREFKILVDLESLFMPRAFSRYIEVLKDFRYSNCYKGTEFLDLPIRFDS